MSYALASLLTKLEEIVKFETISETRKTPQKQESIIVNLPR
jgi:hypothetical protein